MKKFLLLFAAIACAAFVGCSKDDDNDAQNVLVNVKLEGDLASPTLVMLYNNVSSADLDKEKSVSSLANSQKITLKDGTTTDATLSSAPNFTGVNTFNDVPNGKYLLIVYHKPDGYSFPMFYYYGYKDITVDASNTNIYNLEFTYENKGNMTAF